MWNKLSIREKSDYIKLAVKNGITSLDDIHNSYKKFSHGGHKGNYEEWKQYLTKNTGIDPDKDNTYDYRSFYNDHPDLARKYADGYGHAPDTYKTAYHPTFSRDSMYSAIYNRKYNPQGITGGTWSSENDRSLYTMNPSSLYNNYNNSTPYNIRGVENYLIDAENNGASLRLPDGSLPLSPIHEDILTPNEYVPWGGVLPNVDVIGNKSESRKYKEGSWLELAKQNIRNHEGFSVKPYADGKPGTGWRSVGYGFNDSGFWDKYPEGVSKHYEQGISRAQAEEELDYYLDRMVKSLAQTYGKSWDTFTDAQKAAVIDTAYQRPASVSRKSSFYKAVKRGDEKAGDYLGVKGFTKRNKDRRDLWYNGSTDYTIPEITVDNSNTPLHALKAAYGDTATREYISPELYNREVISPEMPIPNIDYQKLFDEYLKLSTPTPTDLPDSSSSENDAYELISPRELAAIKRREPYRMVTPQPANSIADVLGIKFLTGGEKKTKRGNSEEPDQNAPLSRYYIKTPAILPEFMVTNKGNYALTDEYGNPAVTVGAIRDIDPDTPIYERNSNVLEDNQQRTMPAEKKAQEVPSSENPSPSVEEVDNYVRARGYNPNLTRPMWGLDRLSEPGLQGVYPEFALLTGGRALLNGALDATVNGINNVLTNPYVDAGMVSFSGAHGLEDIAKGRGNAMTALEVMPLGGVATKALGNAIRYSTNPKMQYVRYGLGKAKGWIEGEVPQMPQLYRKVKGMPSIENEKVVLSTPENRFAYENGLGEESPLITNFTTDVGVRRHANGNWNWAPTLSFPGEILLGKNVVSTRPSDTFTFGDRVTVPVNKVTAITGREKEINAFGDMGIKTLTSPDVQSAFTFDLADYISKAQRLRSRNAKILEAQAEGRMTLKRKWPEKDFDKYASEIQKLERANFRNPTVRDYQFMDYVFNPKYTSEVVPKLDITEAVTRYPSLVGSWYNDSGRSRYINNPDEWANVMYDPYSPAEALFRESKGIDLKPKWQEK